MRKPKIVITNNAVFVNGKRARRIYTSGSRKRLVANNIIIKLNDEHYRQSSTELRKWKIITRKDRCCFAKPIVGKIRGNGWIAEKLIKFKKGRRTKQAWKEAEKLAQKYNIKDCLTDGKLTLAINWGVDKHNNVIWYDYGY